MNDFFKKLLGQLTAIYRKLTLVQKIIAAGVIIAVVVVLVAALSSSAKPTKIALYDDMNAKDFGAITKKLGEWDYKFVTRGNSVWVSPKDKEYIKMKLAQENLIPQGLKGWELFDTEKWTTTDFERNVNKRRAIIGEITRHLKLLEDIEDVSIEITMPEAQLYTDSEKPITASVIITPAPYSDILKNTDKVKGIINLVAYGVDGLSKDNIVVTDDHGNILSDFSAEEKTGFLEIAKKEYKIKEALRRQMLHDVRDGLKRFIGEDNVDMNLEMELDFDQEKLEKIEYIPMVLKADNPLTPYDESVVQDTVVRSKKNTKEDFEGPGFVPEGPPNVEPNLPPGYKEAANKYAKYKKTEDIVNNEIGEKKSKVDKAPYSIRRLSIAVWVDGKWDRLFTGKGELAFTNKQIRRQYNARSDEDMQKITSLVKGSIGYSPARGDQVIVQNVPFDRTKQFETEDLREWKKLQMKKALFVSLILLLVIFLSTLLVRYMQKEAERRRRLREEELARQQELLRLKALEDAEKGDMEPSLSLEERARLEMEENAKNLAKEHPDSVAKLLRTWMAE